MGRNPLAAGLFGKSLAASNGKPSAELTKTNAYIRRNSEWSSDQWDYTEWEECIEEARNELNGRIDVC